MKSLKLKKQRGFTLVELGIVVAIAAVIVGIGLVVVPNILASTRANAEVSELPSLATKVQRVYANSPNYTGLTTAGLVNLRVFADANVSGTNVRNRWGGAVTVAPVTLGTTADSGFAVTTAEVPRAECIEIAQGMERSARIIAVGATVVKADGAALDMTALGTACNNAVQAMTFTFGK